MAEEIKKRKTLKELYNDPCTVVIDRAFMHQSFQLPGAGQESTISAHRPQTRDLKVVYHPGYGLIGCLKGKYFLSPSANMIVAHEDAIENRVKLGLPKG